MLDPKGLTQLDAISCRPYPIPKFDILDTGTLVALIKPADGVEHFTPYGSAGAPEGRGFLLCPLMCVMVQQVAILGEKAGRFRCIVVRTNQRGLVLLRGEEVPHSIERAGRDVHISVYEE
jgi:hypothetical protein